jgi:hypothetical protein
MPDVISLLHRFDGCLFESIPVGNYRLSIQGSKGHNCYPKIDNLSPYMYDEMEVTVYENNGLATIPPAILYELKHKWDEWYFNNLTVREIQWLYDSLYLYSKLEMQEMMYKLLDDVNSGSIEYEKECIDVCVLSHQITNKDGIFLKTNIIRRMLFKLYGMR